MREILFRGKTIGNEWVYGNLIVIGDCCFINKDMGFNKTVIPETVGQYTGLKDKNGNRIFEGDIVRQDYCKVIKEWYDPDTLGFVDSESIEGHHIGFVQISAHKGVGMRNPISYNDVDGTKRKVNYFVNLASYRCEVIGNRHDNPELLEEEHNR